jgi:hypothetical protein
MYVGNLELEVEGHADIDDGATGIEAMGCWLTVHARHGRIHEFLRRRVRT